MLPLGLAITAPFAGRLADHIGARPLTIAGMITAGAALAVSTIVEDEPLLFLAALAVTGIGLGAFTPPNNAAIMGAAPRHQTGMASGILNMTRGLGTSLGLALAGLAYTAGAGPAKPPRRTPPQGTTPLPCSWRAWPSSPPSSRRCVAAARSATTRP